MRTVSQLEQRVKERRDPDEDTASRDNEPPAREHMSNLLRHQIRNPVVVPKTSDC
jgi:hypothetical protein